MLNYRKVILDSASMLIATNYYIDIQIFVVKRFDHELDLFMTEKQSI